MRRITMRLHRFTAASIASIQTQILRVFFIRFWTKHNNMFRGTERTISELLEFFAGIGSEDTFRRMCVLDALILNVDRHYGNFGVIFGTATMKILGMAPVFDHNRSLLPALDGSQLAAPEWYLQKCKPRLGTDFLLTGSIRRGLKRLESFSFHQHPRIRAEQERLDGLSKIVQNQIHRILST